MSSCTSCHLACASSVSCPRRPLPVGASSVSFRRQFAIPVCLPCGGSPCEEPVSQLSEEWLDFVRRFPRWPVHCPDPVMARAPPLREAMAVLFAKHGVTSCRCLCPPPCMFPLFPAPVGVLSQLCVGCHCVHHHCSTRYRCPLRPAHLRAGRRPSPWPLSTGRSMSPGTHRLPWHRSTWARPDHLRA